MRQPPKTTISLDAPRSFWRFLLTRGWWRCAAARLYAARWRTKACCSGSTPMPWPSSVAHRRPGVLEKISTLPNAALLDASCTLAWRRALRHAFEHSASCLSYRCACLPTPAPPAYTFIDHGLTPAADYQEHAAWALSRTSATTGKGSQSALLGGLIFEAMGWPRLRYPSRQSFGSLGWTRKRASCWARKVCPPTARTATIPALAAVRARRPCHSPAPIPYAHSAPLLPRLLNFLSLGRCHGCRARAVAGGDRGPGAGSRRLWPARWWNVDRRRGRGRFTLFGGMRTFVEWCVAVCVCLRSLSESQCVVNQIHVISRRDTGRWPRICHARAGTRAGAVACARGAEIVCGVHVCVCVCQS